MIIYRVRNFIRGLVNTTEDFSVPPNAVTAENNWYDDEGKLILRQGTELLGNTPNNTSGEITGLHVATLRNGEQIVYRKNGQKLEYLNENLSPADWAEIGTNIFSADEDGDVMFTNYESEAGSFVVCGSATAGLFLLMPASPASYVDVFNATYNFKGWPTTKGKRIILTQYADKGINRADIRAGKVDGRTYTQVSAESIGTGDGVTKTFSGTLAFKAGGATRTCFKIRAYDAGATEVFDDDYCGNLTSPAGGTGTINYVSGAYSITFVTAPGLGEDVRIDHYWQDSNNGGFTDWRFTSPTRVSGEGFLALEPEGGKVQYVAGLGDNLFPFHERQVYKLTISADDLSITNLPYRTMVGVQSPRGVVDTSDGIYYVDAQTEEDAVITRFFIGQSGELDTKAVSTPFKMENEDHGVDLSDYRFDDAALWVWGGFLLVACRHKDSDANDTLFTMRLDSMSWAKHSYAVRAFAEYGGALVAASSISPNVFTLFSGFADEEADITNSVEGKRDDLSYAGEARKFTWWEVRGEIQPNQNLDVYLSYDGADFVKVGTITGNGAYVDTSTVIVVGSHTMGSHTIGEDDEIEASPYRRRIKVMTPIHNEVKWKYVATGVGYVSVTEHAAVNVRRLGQKLPTKHQTVS